MKLTPSQIGRRAELVAKMRDAEAAAVQAVNDFNLELDGLRQKLTTELAASYDDVRREVVEFAEEVAAAAKEKLDVAKNERKAERLHEFHEAWELFAGDHFTDEPDDFLGVLNIQLPEDIDTSDGMKTECADKLEELPESA